MARILMCPPDHFRLAYAINPWMEDVPSPISPAAAHRQWHGLRDAIAAHADVVLIDPEYRCPDMTFTADAGTVSNGVAVLSRYRHPERQVEEPFFQQWMETDGLDVRFLPDDVSYEGGDVILDPDEPWLWAGYGFRSAAEAHRIAGDLLDREVLPLALNDARFYHLDTCCSFLTGGYVVYYPPALTEDARELLKARVPASRRIVVDLEDALQFACNAVNIGDAVITNSASEALTAQLTAAGFDVIETPLGEFLKVGGSARCMTLML